MATQDKPALTEAETTLLVDACIQAKEKAYAPYSKFKVGAALLTESGKLFSGCNVENSAYPVTVCAERCAVVKAVSEGETELRAVSVTTDIPDQFASPCGACRQVMSEFGINCWIVLVKPDRSTRVHKLSELLPFTFTTDDLRAGQNK